MIAVILAAVLVLNPDVTPATQAATICRPGWAQSVRPPSSWTTRLKRHRLAHGGRLADYELDHWIPLSLGGAPRDPANLVLQPLAEARRKDVLERQLHAAVCAGRISLPDAQARIGAWRP